MSNKRIEAVIFDLDDTLISWSTPAMDWAEYLAPVLGAVHQHLIELGHNPGELRVMGNNFGDILRGSWAKARQTHDGVSLGGALLQMCDSVGIDSQQVDAEAMMRSFEWVPMPGVDVYPDTLSTLTSLRSNDYKTGLITNAFQPMWMRDTELVEYNIIDLLDARITSGDTGYIKPHPAVFWRMLGLLNTTPDRAIFVGDSPEHDVRGANEIGMVSVLIDPPHLDRDLEGNMPDYTITSLSELLPIVESLG